MQQLDLSERDPFQAILDAVQAPHEYRAAYDAAVRYCGSDAFFVFPRAAGLSLCTRRPERVFPSICEQLRALNRKEADGINLVGWIGTAFELSRINNSTGRTHPIYTEAIERQGQDAFRTLMQTGPEDPSRRLQLMSVPMLCYNPASPRPFLRGDEEIWPGLGRDERLLRVQICRDLGFGSSIAECGKVEVKTSFSDPVKWRYRDVCRRGAVQDRLCGGRNQAECDQVDEKRANTRSDRYRIDPP